MWSIASHQSTHESVLLALGTVSTLYVAYKVLSLPLPLPDPGVETLDRPASTLPLLGNTLDVMLFHRHRLSDWINEQTDASDGRPWLLRLLFQPPWVVLSMPHDLHDVFVDQFDVFEKGGTVADLSFDVLGHGLLNVNGDTWKRQRRAASHFFSMKHLRTIMEPVLRDKTKQLRDVLAHWSARNDVVSMKALLGKFTSDVFTRIGFGIDLDQLRGNVADDASHPLDRALSAVQYRFQTPTWLWKLGRACNLGPEKRLRDNMRLVKNMVRTMVVKAIETPSPQAATNLLTLLLHENATMDPQALQDTAVNFFIAGKDTTSFSLSWLIVMLNRHPRVLAKIRKEIQELLPDLYTGKVETPTMDDLHALVYLDAAVKESVRLWSVSTYRCATRDTTLRSGAFLPKGTVVVVSKYAAARRPSVWGPDAADYRPERWLDARTGRAKPIGPPQFITFSTGPRKCLGMRLAMLEMKMVVAVLFSRFELETVEDPWTITYDVSFVLPVKGPLAVRVRARGGTEIREASNLRCTK